MMHLHINVLKLLRVVLFLYPGCLLLAQYPGSVGSAGSTAMYKDSTAFIAWATGCRVNRGWQDISNTSLGLATAGDSTMALGKAQSNGALSLGDGGWALCSFLHPLKNGPGADFAVFENAFDDNFLELAFVEVSSDGVQFTRFKAHSLSDTINQTGTFGYTDATKLNNLAGKYRGGYGTPFDLQELAGTPGLNINAVTHVKVVDVVGSLNKAYATRDSYGNKVNDPWPTPFPQGGFDLDAIGVINQDAPLIVSTIENNIGLKVYPNPVSPGTSLRIENNPGALGAELRDASGEVLVRSEGTGEIATGGLLPGVYFLSIQLPAGTVHKKVMVCQ